jgi:hypothetical protein
MDSHKKIKNLKKRDALSFLLESKTPTENGPECVWKCSSGTKKKLKMFSERKLCLYVLGTLLLADIYRHYFRWKWLFVFQSIEHSDKYYFVIRSGAKMWHKTAKKRVLETPQDLKHQTKLITFSICVEWKNRSKNLLLQVLE